MLKIYEYSQCSTCVKALKFLDSKNIKYEKLPIVDQPPSLKELKEMLTVVKESGGSIRSLFNTSGVMYKEMKMSEKLPGMTDMAALKLLAEHGKLVKRPFVIDADTHLVGFKEDVWKKVF